MLILLNPNAAAGTAAIKMDSIGSFLKTHPQSPQGRQSTTTWRMHVMNGRESTAATILNAIRRGENDFVAAGGDGTMNILLNQLLTLNTPLDRERIRIGAIGLGSSNDFHKPFQPEQLVHGISCKLDFVGARPRDVGVVSFDAQGKSVTKYFLVNASIGATAEANAFFNSPNSLLSWLKKVHSPTAILYAALVTIMKFKNMRAELMCSERGNTSMSVSNLGIVKNPHFSGSFCYPDSAHYENGRLTVHLCRDMQLTTLLHLLWSLRHGTFTTLHKTASWTTSSLAVTAREPFAVEFDGEVITTTRALFSVLPRYLKVCP